MASVTICSDFGAPQNKVSHCFPIYLLWSDGTRCHDLSFLNVELFWFPASTLRCSFCNSPQSMETSFSQMFLSETRNSPWLLEFSSSPHSQQKAVSLFPHSIFIIWHFSSPWLIPSLILLHLLIPPSSLLWTITAPWSNNVICSKLFGWFLLPEKAQGLLILSEAIHDFYCLPCAMSIPCLKAFLPASSA